ncbi:hypothetical protein ABPG75_002591 [Micractinium tetrahymenae]
MVQPLLPHLVPQRRVSTQAASSDDSFTVLYSVFSAPRRTFSAAYRASKRRLGWEEPQTVKGVFELWTAQRAAAGLATPTGPLSAGAPSSAAASEPTTPAKPTSEAGSAASSQGKGGIASPASVLVTPLSKVAAQVRRRLLGEPPSVDSAGAPASEASLTDSVNSSVSSHPVAAATAKAAPAVPAEHARKEGQHPAAKFALRAALVLVPIAAAAGMAGAAHARGHRSGRKPADRAGRSPSPADRRVSRSSFDTPREVPYTAPKPFAFAAAK